MFAEAGSAVIYISEQSVVTPAAFECSSRESISAGKQDVAPHVLAAYISASPARRASVGQQHSSKSLRSLASCRQQQVCLLQLRTINVLAVSSATEVLSATEEYVSDLFS